MATASKQDITHIRALRDLCQQAEKLSRGAEELCQRLTNQIEASRASIQRTQNLPRLNVAANHRDIAKVAKIPTPRAIGLSQTLGKTGEADFVHGITGFP